MAEEGHLGRAAERLGLRSPSLSQQIRALESELGTSLFARSATGMTLTAAGAALLPEAQATLAAADRAVRVVGAVATGVRTWMVGVPAGAPPELVRRLRGALGDVGIEPAFCDVASARQLVLLRRGELDCCVLTLPADTDGLETQMVYDEPLGVLLSGAHPLASSAEIDWPDLDGQELLWFPRELAPGYYDAVLAACHAAGWRPELREAAARRAIVAAELLSEDQVVALRPRSAADQAGLTWRPLTRAAPRLRFALSWRRDPAHSGLCQIARSLAS